MVTGIRKKVWKMRREYLLNHRLPSVYRKHLSDPLQKNKVLFAVYRGETVPDNFQLIEKQLRRQGTYQIHTHFLRFREVSLKDYGARAEALTADMATAGYVFLNDANEVVSALPVRKETRIVQLWHACGAFKKFGLSTVDRKFGTDEAAYRKHPSYANLDLVTVSAPEVVWAYEEAMGLQEKPGVVQAAGISRTDVFYDPQMIHDAKKKLLDVFPAAEGRKVILYAPTFRGRVEKAAAPDMLNIAMFAEHFAKECVLLIKHHPSVRNLPPVPEQYRGSFVMDVTGSMKIEDLLMCADVCISDYSSLVFEYSLLERPLFFFAYDLDEYQDWHGFYYDYDEMTPGPVCRTNEELIDAVEKAMQHFDPSKVRAFRNRFMSACDGHATERILQLVFGADA